MTEGKRSWGIIGGGIMGLTLAMRLAEKGHKVTVLELAPKPGGLLGAKEMDGIVWDTYYHVILMSDLNTRRMIREIGLEDKLVWVETKTGFYFDGKLFSMSDIAEFLKFPPINFFDKFRLGLTIISATIIKDWKRMEKIPVEKWLCRWSGRRVFEKIWLPLLKAKLGDYYKETSASFIWTTIQRMYAARKTGLKKEMFGYVTGGYDVINRALEAKLKSMGISLIVNASANRVFKEDSGKIRVETTGGDSYLFDTVISTLPSDISVQIAPSLSVEEIEKHMAIKYLGIFCPSVLIRNPISKYYVTNIIDSWPPFTGIIEMTSLVDPKELNNRTLIYLPKYVDPHSELFNMRDEELNSHFLNGLLKMYPGLSEDEIIHFDTSSSKRVFALPTLRYSEKLPPITTSLQGYYIVNSAQIINSTHNVNEIIQVAEIKLEEILNSFSDN